MRKFIPLLAIFVLVALLLSGLPAQRAEASPGWWDPSWSHRKEITISNSLASALTDYQVKIDVGYESAMQADFDDLRFTNASDTPLDHWLESKTDGSSATVWVEVDDIEASGDTTIYMYYGNPDASSESNGDETFEFFDDFEGDLSKWNVHIDTDVAITASYGNPAPCLEISGGSTSGYPYGLAVIGSDATYDVFQNGIIEADVYPTTSALPEIIFRGNYTANTGYKGRWDTRSGNEAPWMMPPYAYWSEYGEEVPRFGIANQWQKAKLVINGSTFQIYSNDSLKSTETFTDYPGPGEIGLANHYGAYARFDNVRVRKYVSPEPTYSVGSPNQRPDPPSDLGPAEYVDGRWVNDDTPTLEFTQSDPDGTDTVQYTLQIDDDGDFSSPVVDYTSGLLPQDTEYYTPAAALPEGDYYWRVMSTDEYGATSDWTEANEGDVAFRLDTTTEEGGAVKDRYLINEDVEVRGSGFPAGSDVDVYVVEEGEWFGGEEIADYGVIVMDTFTADIDGKIGPEVIWTHPLDIGEYDVVFDADQNGFYDELPDFVDHPNHPGFTVVAVVGGVVGGEVYPINKALVLMPWIGLALALILAAGSGILITRRRRT